MILTAFGRFGLYDWNDISFSYISVNKKCKII